MLSKCCKTEVSNSSGHVGINRRNVSVD